MKNSKRILSALLATVMGVSAFTATAGAVENDSDSGDKYFNKGDTFGYYSEKISHAGKDVKTTDGIVDYLGDGVVGSTDSKNGDGDRCQNYSWSALSDGDNMYIGTCSSSMMQTLKLMQSVLGDKFDDSVMTAALDAMFNGSFYIKEDDDGDPKSVLIKLNTKTGEVKLLMSKATTGQNVQLRNGVKYNGKLYFCGAVNGIPSIVMVDPKTDECKIVYQSMTLAEYYQAYLQGISVGIRGMCEYNGQLVVSMVNIKGAYICATSTPWDSSSYKVIANMDDLCNYPAYKYSDSIYGGSIWDMTEFNNDLYVSICTGTKDNKPDDNTMQSFAIVKASEDENGNWNWQPVIGDKEKDGAKYTFGIDPERTRSGAANLIVYGDHLYIGEYNDEEIALEDILFKQSCDFVNANLEQSVNVYRMDSNDNVELVVGDSDTMFPDGSLTGLDSGFDHNENQYIWRMQVYNNKLYVGTFDTSSLLEPIGQFTNGDLLNMTDEEWNSQIAYIKALIDLIKSKSTSTASVSAAADENITDEQTTAGKEIVSDNSVSNSNINKLENLNKKLEEFKSLNDEKISEESTEKYAKLVSMLDDITDTDPGFGDIYDKLINEETLNKMKSFVLCSAYMATADRGFDLYTIDEDMNVDTITTDGFGDPYNQGCRVFAVTDEGLHLGTANPFYGTQIWKVVDDDNMKLGDVDGDGEVTVMDATLVQKSVAHMEKLSTKQKICADVTDDDAVSVIDATEIQRIVVGAE